MKNVHARHGASHAQTRNATTVHICAYNQQKTMRVIRKAYLDIEKIPRSHEATESHFLEMDEHIGKVASKVVNYEIVMGRFNGY
ncbi:hypothetical protein AN958_01522 [Leucoagaricus sp. SymC.cos]|nr:hypothetical protein AN958_01522 [Leucoagaricus sp. SymC.cos]